MKKIGFWGARIENIGLGTQTWEWCRHMNPAKIMIADLTPQNKLKGYPERFPEGTPLFQIWADEKLIRKFLKGLDVVVCTETPYNDDFFNIAREMGVKSVLTFNYEFLDYYEKPDLPFPDVMLAHSSWHFRQVSKDFGDKCKVEYLPVPVNRDVIKRRQIKRAKTFVHVAGQTLHEDRNGTEIFLKALGHIRTDLKVKIYTQHDLFKPGSILDLGIDPKNLEVINQDLDNYWDLYKTGDVLVMPRRYGGLCLPLNECMAAGMVPMMPNIDPQTEFLHDRMLTPVAKRSPIVARAPQIFAYDVLPETLAYHMDLLHTSNHGAVEALSNYADAYAEVISWSALKPVYDDFLEKL